VFTMLCILSCLLIVRAVRLNSAVHSRAVCAFAAATFFYAAIFCRMLLYVAAFLIRMFCSPRYALLTLILTQCVPPLRCRGVAAGMAFCAPACLPLRLPPLLHVCCCHNAAAAATQNADREPRRFPLCPWCRLLP